MIHIVTTPTYDREIYTTCDVCNVEHDIDKKTGVFVGVFVAHKVGWDTQIVDGVNKHTCSSCLKATKEKTDP